MQGHKNALNYDHPELVNRLALENGWSSDEAVGVFQDTLRFLVLCAVTGAGHAPTRQIDTGWHTFLLYTSDYERYCKDNFGRFLHHQPTQKLKGEAHCYRLCSSKLEGQSPTSMSTRLQTREAAQKLFGKLSSNWQDIAKSDCCSTKECCNPL